MNDKFAAIKSRFEAEQRTGARALTASDIPLSYEALTPAWLTSILCAGTPGAEVVTYRLGEVDEGTSSRRRIFLSYNDAGLRAGLPPTVFCKSTHTLQSRYMLALNRGIRGEVTFYNEVRPTLDIEAPRSLHANYDPESFNSIIVMEDLGQKVEFCRHWTAMTRERAQGQLALLARLHGRHYGAPANEPALASFITWPEFFTITADDAGFGEACIKGFTAAEEVVPPALFRREPEIWPATLASVARHRELPHSLIHSDVHLKNWYITADGNMGLNDWQCVCKGHWSRDVAYVMATSLGIEQRRAWEQDLLRYYLDQLAAAGAPAIDFDEAWLNYRQQMFAALAWWTGTLIHPPDAPEMQPRDSSLEFIKRITYAIEDLDALGSFRGG